jgi:hypothetical protein
MKYLMSSCNFLDKLIARVKTEGGNLSTFARAFNYVVNYNPLGIVAPWQGYCFGHTFNKTCQYVCNDAYVRFGLERSI